MQQQQQQDQYITLFRKIPIDIIINHILPFTQQPQSREHLENIRNYVIDTRILNNYYPVKNEDHVIMMNNILRFCSDKKLIEAGSIILLKRHFCYTTINYNDFIVLITKFGKQNKFSNSKINIKRFNFLWGLLTVRERTQFINDFVLRF